MLHTADPQGRLAELYALRDPLYREVADHVVESERDGVLRFVRWLADDTRDARNVVPFPVPPEHARREPPRGDDARPLPAVQGEGRGDGG